METRSSRYELRFESGKRRGERVQLAPGALVVGRAASCDVHVHDPSVSSRHAELVVDGDGVRLTDLNSTNGTRVGGQRITTAFLAHGDRISLGQVELSVHDDQFGGGAPDELSLEAGAEARLGEAAEGNALERLELPAGTGGRGRGLLLLAIGLAGAGFLGWQRWTQRTQVEVGETARAPRTLGRNLLGDPSFEQVGAEPASSEAGVAANAAAGSWRTAGAAPRALRVAARFAAAGEVGLGAELGVDEWSFALSEPLPVSGARALLLDGELRARETAGAADAGMLRVGLRFTDDRADAGAAGNTGSAGSAGSIGSGDSRGGDPIGSNSWLVWHGEGFQRVADYGSFDALLPVAPGYDAVQIVVAAKGPGEFSLDELGLVPAPKPEPVARFLENEVYAALGSATAIDVVRGGRAPFRMATAGWTAAGLHGDGALAIDAKADENGFVFSLRSEGAALGGGGLGPVAALLELDGEDAWVGTLGPDGFAARARGFEEQVDSVVFGAGGEVLSLRFPVPTLVRGEVLPFEGRTQLRMRIEPADAGAGEATTWRLQMRFRDEVTRAKLLRDKALRAEADGRPADALIQWAQLLDEVPFAGALVEEAQASSSRLVAEGLEGVEGVRRELSSARFFGLSELYRAARGKARELVQAYAGTDVEAVAGALVEEIDTDLALAEEQSQVERRTRLQALLESNALRGATALRERLEMALEGRSPIRVPDDEGETGSETLPFSAREAGSHGLGGWQ